MEVWSPDIIDAIAWFALLIGAIKIGVHKKKNDEPMWRVEDWYGDNYTCIKLVHKNYNSKGRPAYNNSRFAIEVGRVYHNEENRYEKLLELIAEGEERAIEQINVRELARGSRA